MRFINSSWENGITHLGLLQRTCKYENIAIKTYVLYEHAMYVRHTIYICVAVQGLSNNVLLARNLVLTVRSYDLGFIYTCVVP